MEDSTTIRTSIKPELLRKTLFRGSFLALLGFIPLIYGSLFLNVNLLHSWGIFIVIFSFGLIAYGMIPFRKLTSIEKNPSRLVVYKDHLQYFIGNDPILLLPFESIDNLGFISGDVYGIGVKLKDKKVTVFNKRGVRNIEGYDLFFPYFTEQSQTRLNKIVHF